MFEKKPEFFKSHCFFWADAGSFAWGVFEICQNACIVKNRNWKPYTGSAAPVSYELSQVVREKKCLLLLSVRAVDGQRQKKSLSLLPPLPSPPKTLSLGGKKLFKHTHTHKLFPSDLPASSCPCFLGSWSCWDTGAGEIPSPLCSLEPKWIKWTRCWRSLRSHRGEGRDGERSWEWRRKGRARNSVTQVVCATCTSVLLVRKQECSCSPWDNVPVWYPLLMHDRRASYSHTLLFCILWKLLVGEVIKAGNWKLLGFLL